MAGVGQFYCFFSYTSLTEPFFSRSQSRMRGDYLFYEEKIETTPEEREAKAARR